MTSNTADSLRRLTQHFGLPILTQMDTLPEQNMSGDAPEKVIPSQRATRRLTEHHTLTTRHCLRARGPQVISILCATRERASSAYAPFNAALYDQLQSDRTYGLVPPLEPFFERFDNGRIECNHGAELTQGGTTLPVMQSPAAGPSMNAAQPFDAEGWEPTKGARLDTLPSASWDSWIH